MSYPIHVGAFSLGFGSHSCIALTGRFTRPLLTATARQFQFFIELNCPRLQLTVRPVLRIGRSLENLQAPRLHPTFLSLFGLRQPVVRFLLRLRAVALALRARLRRFFKVAYHYLDWRSAPIDAPIREDSRVHPTQTVFTFANDRMP